MLKQKIPLSAYPESGIQYLRWESNPNLKFRKLPFYPLNYRGRQARKGASVNRCKVSAIFNISCYYHEKEITTYKSLLYLCARFQNIIHKTMKKITVIAAAVLVLAACQSKQKSQNAAAEVADSCAVVVDEQVCELDSAAQEADTLVAVIEEVAE